MVELCPKKDCTGCLACKSACLHNAIDLYENNEGFIYPQINAEVCIECGLCRKACPILSENKYERTENIVYGGWSIKQNIRRNSSSGGLFYTFAEYFIKEKDGYVFGAAFNEEFNSVKHICVHSLDELHKLMGSKYVQSNIGNSFREVKQLLTENKNVLFVGTPCQIAGLKTFLHKEFLNLLTIDLVCHGVPSPLVFKKYIYFLSKKYNSKVDSFSFRDKKWSWNRFNIKLVFTNKVQYLGKWEEDPYMRGFLRELFLRKSCHNCCFANTNRPADITMADFWGYHRIKGEKRDKDKGVSMIMINNEVGNNWFSDIKSRLYCVRRPFQDAVSCNQALRQCFPENKNKANFWSDFLENGFSDVLINKYLYPEKINNNYKYLYKYGKNIYTLILLTRKIYRKCITLFLNKNA